MFPEQDLRRYLLGLFKTKSKYIEILIASLRK